jgi:PEP-CTERM motif
MRSLRIAFASLALALSASSAQAGLTFDFQENGLGDRGPNPLAFRSVESPIYTITATGTADLYVKTDGPGETGLGLANDHPDHEIKPVNSIDLNVVALKSLYNITSLTLSIGSVQDGENYQVYKGSIATGNLLTSGTGTGGSVTFTTPNLFSSSINDYIVTTTNGDVVIESAVILGSAVPEPSSFALMGIAGAVGLVVRRVRKGRVA